MPDEPDRSEVTGIVDALGRGEGRSARDLPPLVYDELRRVAASRLAHEGPGPTLQPTALVHEASPGQRDDEHGPRSGSINAGRGARAPRPASRRPGRRAGPGG